MFSFEEAEEDLAGANAVSSVVGDLGSATAGLLEGFALGLLEQPE
ncbi:MAG: hypothetical protein WCH11_00550 [Bdellovibrio sp.]